MNGTRETLLRQLATLAAADLEILATLHDREIDPSMLARIEAAGFPENLALCPQSPRAEAAVRLLRQSLDELHDDPAPARFDAIAADFAAIYLNHSLRAAPMESVWRDDEQLAMQGPMFEVRAWMARHGLAVANWRLRPDDHLVHELLFLAHLLRGESSEAAFAEAADFLDRHLLLWIEDFANRVATRCATGIYAGLNLLTAFYVGELRDLLGMLLDAPRPTREAMEARIAREQAASAAPPAAPMRYMPGVGPSW